MKDLLFAIFSITEIILIRERNYKVYDIDDLLDHRVWVCGGKNDNICSLVDGNCWGIMGETRVRNVYAQEGSEIN